MAAFDFAWRSWYAVSFQGNASRLMNAGNGNLASWFPPYAEPNFEQMTDNGSPSQQWHFISNNNSDGTWLVRCAGAGSSMYLSTYGLPPAKLNGRTIATLKYADQFPNDESMVWSVKPWGDGWYGLTNKANGSDWYLTVTMTGGVGYELYMAHAAGPTGDNRFNFTTTGAMNTYGFMRAQMPGTMVNASTLTTATKASTNSDYTAYATDNVCHNNSIQAADVQSISPGASAAIAAAVTFVICLLTFGAAWLSLRRGYKGRGQGNFDSAPTTQNKEMSSSPPFPPITSFDTKPAFEPPTPIRRPYVQSQIQEIGTSSTYTELDASNRRTRVEELEVH